MTAACLWRGSGGEMVIVRVRGIGVSEKDIIHLRKDERCGGGVFARARGSFR